MSTIPLDRLEPARRLALGLFLLTLLAFYGLAQAKLVTEVGVAGAFPGPREVLHRYHGDPTARTRLHLALDPDLPQDDPRRMYAALGASEEECAQNRLRVLGWVEAGAPREGWPSVAPIFTDPTRCAMCHSRKPDDEGKPRKRADLPFDTYEDVVAAAQIDTGLSVYDLATSSHNHLFGFAVASLLVSWIFVATRWRGPLVGLLVASAFGGALLDVASWWLTKWHGSPWQWGVIAGGGLFGASLVAMAVLALDELLLRSWVARKVVRLLPLRVAHLESREEAG